MAWGLEARVPFLDKKFLEVAMNVDAKYKEFNKGSAQEEDAEGRPKMEKVSSGVMDFPVTSRGDMRSETDVFSSTSYEKPSTALPMEKPTYPTLSSGDKKNNSPMVSDTLGSTE